MPLVPESNWKSHVKKWAKCERCPLHSTRRKVVLCRGSLPCDVLFIGEAPGVSEDVHGIPFFGPAGHLLDHLISEAGGNVADHDISPLRMAFTNLVGCIPIGDDGDKTREPSKESIKACEPRVVELVKLAKPKLVVFVGQLSEKTIVKAPGRYGIGVPTVSIIHPAAILRADISQKGFAIQRAVVTLADAFCGDQFQQEPSNGRRR